MSDIVIKAEHLSKMYRLGVINNGTLWKDIQTWSALKFGKEDPHSRIGEDKYLGSEDYFWALKNIDFEIHQGDRVGIIGKNGAGKSTLLKILSRVTSPTEGSIKIKGKIASLLEVGTGFNGELTGRENIYLNGAILGMKKRQIDRKLDEIIDFSEIEHHIDTPVKRYSSGMYVRLAFAVAAHLDSDILIADEVLAVGDAAFQKKALGKMQDLSTGQGRTVLFVSHNIVAVKALCNKGILLNQGEIIYQGDLNSTISKYMNKTIEQNLKWVYRDEYKKTKNIKILDILLLDSFGNQINRSIANTEKIFLQIKFAYLNKDPNLTIGFTLFNSENSIVYRSLTTDQIEFFNSSFIIGENIITCEVPIIFLKSGLYNLNIDASIHNLEWIINPETDQEYSIALNIDNNSFALKQSSNGLISPLVNWELQT